MSTGGMKTEASLPAGGADVLSPVFSIDLSVRDYELDAQAIINNSVYLNYFEHCRHMFLRAAGLDFSDLHARGIDPVVVRVEVDYRRSLRSGDNFRVSLAWRPAGRIRFDFIQQIRRIPDNALIADAVVTATVLVNGRPSPCEEITRAMREFEGGKAQTDYEGRQ